MPRAFSVFWRSALGLRCLPLCLSLLAVLWAPPAQGQVNHSLAGSSRDVAAGSAEELLGDVTLTKSGTTVQTTVASTIEILYDVPITNLFPSPLVLSQVTGVISSNGITLTFRGGYLSSGVSAHVTNGGTGGRVSIALPEGLLLTESSSITISGVRGSLRQSTSGTNVDAWVQATPGTAHVFVEPSIVRVAAAKAAGTLTAPTIASAGPAEVTAGNLAFSLTVNGMNFISGSQVRWENAEGVVYYPLTKVLTSTQLTASIPAYSFAQSGTAKVSVETPAPGGVLASNAVPILLREPADGALIELFRNPHDTRRAVRAGGYIYLGWKSEANTVCQRSRAADGAWAR